MTLGQGSVSVLLWSQMHGDESTASMSLADIVHWWATSREDDPLRRRLTDEQAVGLAHVLHDGLIQLVSPGANGGIAHDTGESDDRDVRGAAADVDDHAACRRLHGQPNADRRRHRLGDHQEPLDARGAGGVTDRDVELAEAINGLA